MGSNKLSETNNISEENLIWTALDAKPLIPNDWNLFWKAWNQHAGPSYLIKSDPAGNQVKDTNENKEFFKGLNIYAEDELLITDGHWRLPYLNYKEIFPNLLDDIYAAMPWVDSVQICRLWNSSIPIAYHRDYSKEPVAIRAMIYDENPSGTFKVFKMGSGKNYVKLPADTNWFAYNNHTCLHGSDKITGVEKIILLIVHTLKDKSAMEEHFKVSAEKYPGHYKYS
jgi:hypothetical protein